MNNLDSPDEIEMVVQRLRDGRGLIEFGDDLASPNGKVRKCQRELLGCFTDEERRRVLRKYPGYAHVEALVFRCIDEAFIEGEVKVEREPPR